LMHNIADKFKEERTMNISERCKGVSPSVTLSLTAKAKELSAQGKNIISFGVGEPDFVTPEAICDAAKEALDKGLTHYTDASGTPELKKTICLSLEKEHGLKYRPSQIVVSNGAKQSLFNICQAILDPGDEVILPSPYWLTYPELIKFAGATPVYAECGENLILDIGNIEKAITSKTRAVIINNPNNPTGALYPEAVIRELAEVAVRHDLTVISDEIYDKLVYDVEAPPSIATMPGMLERTIIVNGVSKTYAMTGWRIGWTASPLNAANAMSAYQSHSTSGPNTMAQYAAAHALAGPQESVAAMKAEFKKRRDYAISRIEKMDGVGLVYPGGAFYIMMDVSGAYRDGMSGSVEFSRRLLEENFVAAVPGAAFGDDNYIRLSYAASMEDIAEGLDRIEAFIRKYR